MLHRSTACSLSLVLCLVSVAPAADKLSFPATLPRTEPLTIPQPLDEVMVDGINRFALREIAASVEKREQDWHRDYSSPEAYEKSIAPNRERFRKYIGAVDERVKSPRIELRGTTFEQVLADHDAQTVLQVSWPVLEGVHGEALVLKPPTAEIKGLVIALPDANGSPEEFLTLNSIPHVLAYNGFVVLMPRLINRNDTFSGNPEIAMTNMPHREFVYRMAFEMGRHVIGYEVQKVLAAVDAFEELNRVLKKDLPIGVFGWGEGGLIALYSAALDPRIDAVTVSRYFQQRENVWEEPIYRNVWRLLTEFGDAEIASLVAPRPLIIEAGAFEISGPPEAKEGRRNVAAPGRITTAPIRSVRAEFERARQHYAQLGYSDRIQLVNLDEGDEGTRLRETFVAFITNLGFEKSVEWEFVKVAFDSHFDPQKGQHRQVKELVDYTQNLLENSAKVRDKFWAQADRSSVEVWEKSAERYRDYVWDEMIGRLPKPDMPMNPRSRKVLDEAEYQGYEVVLDVYPDVIASGILLLPADLQEGEKRPVVVCQHGLEGTPRDTITAEPGNAYNAYKSFSVQLVKQGFIVYAPQNPYRGRDRFRTIQRKSNPLGRSLFSYILRQHERTLDWLSSLPYVDPQRIGFYGLSYGGKTAVRVPPLLPQYALSICSADYNEWIRKNVTVRDRYSYMFTFEYEMPEWNMGHTANYAELASLMTPRPFMVERGHNDGVAPDEWVAWEYAKVRRHYDQLGLGDKTEIEFFNGPHTIHGVGTFAFLKKHLKWGVGNGE